MNKIIVSLLVLGLAVSGNAQNSAQKAGEVDYFKAGGTPIAIPTPVTDMVEVGYDIRERMELFVPPVNRLLAAFLIARDIPQFTNGAAPPRLTRYAMVQVPRQAEFADARPADFAQVVEGVKQQFAGSNADPLIQSAEEEIRQRLKLMNIDKSVSLGKPVPLGTFFSKPDAYGFGLVSPVSVGTNTMTLGMGGAVVRVKSKVLFVYLYSEYKDESSVVWLRNATEQWASNLLAKNK